MKKKLPLHLRTYTIVSRAVEEGIAHGLRRYLKYHDEDEPIDTDTIAAEYLEHEILNALSAVIDFDDEE